MEFLSAQVPPKLDYAQEENWAVLPQKWDASLEEVAGKPELKKADVFFISEILGAHCGSGCISLIIQQDCLLALKRKRGLDVAPQALLAQDEF